MTDQVTSPLVAVIDAQVPPMPDPLPAPEPDPEPEATPEEPVEREYVVLVATVLQDDAGSVSEAWEELGRVTARNRAGALAEAESRWPKQVIPQEQGDTVSVQLPPVRSWKRVTREYKAPAEPQIETLGI